LGVAKALVSLSWKVGLIIIPVYLSWLTLFAPAQQSALTLSEAARSFQPFLEVRSLQQKLADLDLKDLKIKDRASVERYYQDGRAARDKAGRDLALSQKKLTLNIFPIKDRDFYLSVQEEIDSANKLLVSFIPLYQNVYDLLNYYESSSLALYNFFYYDPHHDLKVYDDTLNYKALQQLFGQASNGLEKEAEQINKLPNFPDPSLVEFRKPIQELSAQAKKISDSASEGSAVARREAQDFATKVDQLQERLLANRRDFWGSLAERTRLIEELGRVQTKSGDELTKILNKRNELKSH
jgi:hypothetical protein